MLFACEGIANMTLGYLQNTVIVDIFLCINFCGFKKKLHFRLSLPGLPDYAL